MCGISIQKGGVKRGRQTEGKGRKAAESSYQEDEEKIHAEKWQEKEEPREGH